MVEQKHHGQTSDSRLTVIEAAMQTGQYGSWTELEVWYWFLGDAHPRRFRLSVDGRVDVRIGDLVRRDPRDPRQLLWWNNRNERRSGRLLLVSEVEELQALE